MGIIITILLSIPFIRDVLRCVTEEINFAIENFPRVLFANLAGTLICPTQYDLCEIQNKIWYKLLLGAVLGLLIVTIILIFIDSSILKIFFVVFTALLILGFYLRSIDETITSN